MRRFSNLVLLGALMACSGHANAQEKVDWRLYGTATYTPKTSGFTFYDVVGLEINADKHVVVWTKATDLAEYDAKKTEYAKDEDLQNRVIQKMETGYVPPASDLKFLDPVDIMGIEDLANRNVLKTIVRVRYELDCVGKKSRQLDTWGDFEGSTVSVHKPTEWAAVPPETNISTLLRYACPKK